MKTDGKVATAEEVLVAKGENLVANATDTDKLKNIKLTESALVMSAPLSISHFTVC